VFEQTIREVGASEEPLLEKNKTFLKVYVEKVAALQPETAEEREHMFEERLQLKQQGNDLNVIHVPVPKKTDEAKILDELADIKKMLHFIMDRVRARL
jgi:nicotinamide mononucleotide adenylyltransferase